MTRSALAGKGLKAAKEGHTLGGLTMSLFYATDFADRLENEMIPALRAGFVVLTDRYIYSLMARAIVRGADPDWVKGVYEFALKPDMVIYLRATVDELVTRVVQTAGFNYWESGMDLHLGEDMYDSFVAVPGPPAGRVRPHGRRVRVSRRRHVGRHRECLRPDQGMLEPLLIPV